MTEEEFASALQHAVFAFQTLEGHDWETVVATCMRAESVGPILHPSEFIAGSGNLELNKKVAVAARAFVDNMRPLMAEAERASGM